MITDIQTFDRGDGTIRVSATVDTKPVNIILIRAVLQTLNTLAEKRAVAAYLLRLAARDIPNAEVITNDL